MLGANKRSLLSDPSVESEHLTLLSSWTQVDRFETRHHHLSTKPSRRIVDSPGGIQRWCHECLMAMADPSHGCSARIAPWSLPALCFGLRDEPFRWYAVTKIRGGYHFGIWLPYTYWSYRKVFYLQYNEIDGGHNGIIYRALWNGKGGVNWGWKCLNGLCLSDLNRRLWGKLVIIFVVSLSLTSHRQNVSQYWNQKWQCMFFLWNPLKLYLSSQISDKFVEKIIWESMEVAKQTREGLSYGKLLAIRYSCLVIFSDFER